MQNIIRELNRNVGIIGSMIITDDGMVVAQALGPELDSDLVAAIGSNVVRGTTRALAPLSGDEIARYVLSSSHGKMMFVNMKNSFLIVVTHQNIDLANTLIEINSAAYKITHRRTS